MEIVKWGILLVLVLPVPFILGMIPVKHMDGTLRTPAMTYVCGWFVSFFVFELVAMPFILLEKPYSMLVVTYSLVVLLIAVLSLVIGRGLWRDYLEGLKRSLKCPIYVKIGWLCVALVIAFQMAYAVMYEYYDGDDAYYVATSVLTKTFNSMYLRDPYTGAKYSLDVRHAFSPTPIYQAWLSSLSHIAPSIIAHSVLGAVWLLFMYCIYVQLGRLLFKKNENYVPVFVFLIALWYMFGNVSLYTSETFAMTRTWQGKGLMAGMVIPALFLCLAHIAGDRVDAGIWLMLVCVCVSGVFATSVSFMLVPTLVGTAAIIIGIRKKSAACILKIFGCCIPCMALSVCYVVMR